MTLRSKVEHTFKLVMFLIIFAVHARAGVIGKVTFVGCEKLPCSELSNGTLLRAGLEFSEELLKREMTRVDSIYFSRGFLQAVVSFNTSSTSEGIDIVLRLSEGDEARVGKLGLSGVDGELRDKIKELLSLSEGDFFDPLRLEEGMRNALSFLLNSGYPYAQVWMTGFSFNRESNSVDITISVVRGNRSIIRDIVFEGLSRTDSSFAVRLTRLKRNELFREEEIERGIDFLSRSGCFESVGAYRVEKDDAGGVRLIIPVKEKKRSNSFQGVIGFAKKEERYVLNGSIDLRLRNLAGTGRNALFRWLNTGERYSSVDFSFFEPFLLGSPVNVTLEMKQVVQDSTYTSSYGGLSIEYPIDASNSLVVGAAVDRNIPGFGELLKSTRQRYRVGFVVRDRLFFESFLVSAEGVFRNRYYSGDRKHSDYESIYNMEMSTIFDITASQSLFVRIKTEGVVSKSEIPLAEKMLLGGANSLRGYRENQFRGDDVVFTNVEYRFGRDGAFFLFNDIGAYYLRGEGWRATNGMGFGLRSTSPVGDVTLSFGVGDRVSFEGTKIHISMYQRF